MCVVVKHFYFSLVLVLRCFSFEATASRPWYFRSHVLSHHEHHCLHKWVHHSGVHLATADLSAFGVLVRTVLSRTSEPKLTFDIRVQIYTFLTLVAGWEVLASLLGMYKRTVLLWIQTIWEMFASHLFFWCACGLRLLVIWLFCHSRPCCLFRLGILLSHFITARISKSRHTFFPFILCAEILHTHWLKNHLSFHFLFFVFVIESDYFIFFLEMAGFFSRFLSIVPDILLHYNRFQIFFVFTLREIPFSWNSI